MINIPINLVPFGFMEPKSLGKIVIFNEGTGTTDSGNYTMQLLVYDDDGDELKLFETRIKAFPRTRANVFALLAKCLAKIAEESPAEIERIFTYGMK